jgi:hypothetical protein
MTELIKSGQLNENINDLILDLSLLIKTEKLIVNEYLELNSTKVNNRRAQFYKDIIIFGNEDININNFGRISNNLGSLRINNTNMYIKQNLNVKDTIFIDYIGNTSDIDYATYISGGVISNITKLQNLILHNDIIVAGNIKVNGIVLNYGNTYISNSLYVNSNIYVGPQIILENIIFSNSIIFNNDTYPIVGNIYGNSLNVSQIYSNNIYGNILNYGSTISANLVYSNQINISNIYTVNELFNSYFNIDVGNINYIVSTENIFLKDYLQTDKLQLVDLNVTGNISQLNIKNYSDKYYTKTINTKDGIFINLYNGNLIANTIFINDSLIIGNSTIETLNIKKINIISLNSNNYISIEGGLNVYNNCNITGDYIYNNIDGVTVAQNLITINSLKKNADSGIAFSYSDKYIGYIYKYYNDDIYDANTFIFGNINSVNIDNLTISINNLIPIYVKQIEGNINYGLTVGKKGNIIINNKNIYTNNNLYQTYYLFGNNILSNNIISEQINANNIYGNIYDVSYIDGNNILISNLDQINSNIIINNVDCSIINIFNLSSKIINSNIINNGSNINANTINNNILKINGNIFVNNLNINENVSCNTILIKNISLYSNNTIEFITANKILTNDINIFTKPSLHCNINSPQYDIINNTFFYQKNIISLLYDNEINGNIYISLPRGKINLNKEDYNRKLYFNNEQWIDFDNKSFYPYYQYTYIKGISNFNDAGQGYSCKLNPNGKYLISGGPRENNNKGNIWLFERNVTLNGILNMGWTQITTLYIEFNNYPTNSISYLGNSLDCNADCSIIISGALYSRINGIDNRGAVVVFENNNNNWVGNIIYDSINTSLYFGNSCSISSSGNHIAIGRNTDNSNTGNVFIYLKPILGWSSGIYTYINISGSGITTNSNFGSIVKFGSENILCVGGNNKVWLFRFNGISWIEFQNLNNPSIYSGFGNYGIDFSTLCDILVISAPLIIGEICIYQYFNNQYRLIQKIQSNNYEGLHPYQGVSLSVSGDGRTIVYGAPYSGSANQGGIYIIRRFCNKWIEVIGNSRYAVNIAEGNNSIAYYQGLSISLSLDGSIMAVGGPGYSNGIINNGTIGIYY